MGHFLAIFNSYVKSPEGIIPSNPMKPYLTTIFLCFSYGFFNPLPRNPSPPGDIEPHAQLGGAHGRAAQLAVPVAVGRVPIGDGEPVAGPGAVVPPWSQVGARLKGKPWKIYRKP